MLLCPELPATNVVNAISSPDAHLFLPSSVSHLLKQTQTVMINSDSIAYRFYNCM